jgi:hypothetical protein
MVIGVRKPFIVGDFGHCGVLLENNFAKFETPSTLNSDVAFFGTSSIELVAT